jgi:hypothetical protein
MEETFLQQEVKEYYELHQHMDFAIRELDGFRVQEYFLI